MDTPKPYRVLRDAETTRKTGVPRASRYELIAAGNFPRPINLGGERVGWLEHELDDWIAARIRASRGKAAAA